MKKMMIIIMLLLGLSNYITADEVKSFATQQEQKEYAKKLIDKLPPEPKLMTAREVREKRRVYGVANCHGATR